MLTKRKIILVNVEINMLYNVSYVC